MTKRTRKRKTKGNNKGQSRQKMKNETKTWFFENINKTQLH